MWHYPDSSCNELLELVFPLLVSSLLAIGVHEPVIILVQSLHINVRDLGHHCSQLHVARPLKQMDRQVFARARRLKAMRSQDASPHEWKISLTPHTI